MADAISAYTIAEIDAAIARIDGVTPGTAAALKALILDASKRIDTIDIVKDGLEIGGTPVTITAAEANVLDGITAVVAELNKLAGLTADTAELNKLDGMTATTAELNKADKSVADGIAEASKNVILDANKDLLGKRYDINQSVLGLIASGPFMRFETGLSPRMNAGNASDLNFADGDFSIVICHMVDGTQEVRIGKGAISSADQGYEVRFQTDGDIEVFVSDGATYIINTSSSPLGQYVAGEVFILVFSFDKDGNLTQYYNGIVQGTLDISAHDEKSVSNNSNFYIDRVSAGGHSQYFQRYYNKCLTLAEVRALSSGIPVAYVDAGASMTTKITNGSMEADANWANHGTPTTNERSAVQKHGGANSRKFIIDAANEGIKGDVFTTVTGKRDRHILWVYPDDATVVNVGVQKGDNSGWLYNQQHTGLVQDQWNRIVIEVTETAGGAGAFIAVHSGAVSDVGHTWYVDDVWSGQIGNVARFEPGGMFYLSWADGSDNENHAEVVGAAPQNFPPGHVARYVKKGLTEDTKLVGVWPMLWSIVKIIYKEKNGKNTNLQVGLSQDTGLIASDTAVGANSHQAMNANDYITSGYFLSADYSIFIGGVETPYGKHMEFSTVFDNDVGTPTVNERSDEQVHGGLFSHKFMVNAINEGTKSDVFTTTTGRKYKYKIWIYPDDSTKVTIVIRKGDDSGDLYNNEFTGLNQDAWNEITLPELTEIAGGAFAFFAITSGTVAAGTWYIDDVVANAWNGAKVDFVFVMERAL